MGREVKKLMYLGVKPSFAEKINGPLSCLFGGGPAHKTSPACSSSLTLVFDYLHAAGHYERHLE